jgi:hypothetical protein
MQVEIKSAQWSESKEVQCDWIVLGDRSYFVGLGSIPRKGFFSEATEVYQYVKVLDSKSRGETKILFVLPQEHTTIEFKS